MLADGIEATARVLHEPTPESIRDVVEHIVRQRMEQGQLDDAPLTLRQIETIKERVHARARGHVSQSHRLSGDERRCDVRVRLRMSVR